MWATVTGIAVLRRRAVMPAWGGEAFINLVDISINDQDLEASADRVSRVARPHE